MIYEVREVRSEEKAWMMKENKGVFILGKERGMGNRESIEVAEYISSIFDLEPAQRVQCRTRTSDINVPRSFGHL